MRYAGKHLQQKNSPAMSNYHKSPAIFRTRKVWEIS